MTVHYYAFGSVCRGEVDRGSDIDLLACVSGERVDLDPQKFSIYSHDRLAEMWRAGSPFAWHIHRESRLLYASDGLDFVVSLGEPGPYQDRRADCEKFERLFEESSRALAANENSSVFHLSCMFLAMRNFATCYSFGSGVPIFSRRSPLLLKEGVPIRTEIFDIFARARILSTRGYGQIVSDQEIDEAKKASSAITQWMRVLLSSESFDERV
ncbi:nucleotidyltransferase domain-containing protein [Trinickia dinghuensis]|uniref:Nucleotidyltransferase n=1 Tax=Trinickia dinghuensis TaxID=2291023 RepID=A0A3D8K4G4_9BURK|nr:nucleotidyltransferase [Trinickia dinghuensis]